MDPQIEGQLRSLLITIFSIVGTLGYLKGVDAVALASAVLTIGGFAWSWYSNRPKSLAAQAAQSDEVVEVKMADQATANSIPNDKVTGPLQ